jgi:PST family polysaccharide transporter
MEPQVTKEKGASLSERTVSAAQWRLVASIVQGGMQFAVGVFLARLLLPADFGVVALAMVVIGFAGAISDFGLEAAVIQRRDLTERHLRAALTASVLVGLGLAAGLALASPFSGVVLESSILPGVLQTLALVFAIGALGGTSRSLLRRELRFKALFWSGAVSYLVGYAGVVTVLALRGHGAWSLVWGALTQTALETALVMAVVRPPLRPLLARTELRELFGFGAGVSMNSVVNYLARNGDNLIVGSWLGPAALGLYGRAYNLMTLPLNYLGAAAHQVLFPAMAEIQQDRDRVGRAYLLSVQISALTAAPIMAGMAVAAPHMVTALYGPRWGGMVIPLQLLCAAGLLRAIYHLAGSVTYAAGFVYSELRRQVVYAVLVVIGAVAGTRWGVPGVALGVFAAILYMYVAMASLALRIVGRGWKEFLLAQLPGVLVAALVGAAALLVRTGLERAGYASGWIFAALLATCAVAVPLAIFLLPDAVRPAGLFARFDSMLARLPSPLHNVAIRILHLQRVAP